jgi:2,4-dienoyl-CoA reductase-like NADH-dependent reductase (Old Yellow Enzyme family)/thioredoxin reductase
MNSRYSTVLSPIDLGPVKISNRVYFAPHGVQMTVGAKPSTDHVAYLAERAKGGAGLVVATFTVHDRGRSAHTTPYPEETVPALRVMSDAIHDAGGKIFAETFYHWGCTGRWEPLGPPAPALSASANQFRLLNRASSTREMSRDDIRRMVAAHAQSARHLRQAGFDGVMVHATHGALLEHFLSPYFNRRTDEYGGSLENRMRFMIEALEAVRSEAGNSFAVGMRFNCDELLLGGYGADEAYEVLSRVSKQGLLDYVDLDIAVEPNQYNLGMPSVFVTPHLYRPYVEAVRKAAGAVPVLSTLSRLTSMADGEALITAGVCDMVGAVRALIAEPELVNNARDGQEDRSRTCIACNWCKAARTEGAQGCAINPSSYRERRWGVGTIAPAPRRAKVVIAGGGPAGLEAARVSALRGHDVTLFEQRDRLGGGLACWASLPGREFFFKSIEWWERELERLGVKVRTGACATADAILGEAPDAVIIATGSTHSTSGQSAFDQNDIPGHDQDFVYCAEDILVKGARPTGKVIVLDGEGLHAGVGVAELLGREGAQVEFVRAELSPVSIRLEESLEVHFLMRRLDDVGVKITTATYIRKIGRNNVTLFNVHTDKEHVVEGVDAVVLVTSRVPVNALEGQLEGKVSQLYTVGDALAARMLASATYEGHMFARLIGEPDAAHDFSEAYYGPASPLYASPAADRPA